MFTFTHNDGRLTRSRRGRSLTTPFTAALSSAVLTGSLTGLALSSCASAPEDQDDVSACAVPPCVPQSPGTTSTPAAPGPSSLPEPTPSGAGSAGQSDPTPGQVPAEPSPTAPPGGGQTTGTEPSSPPASSDPGPVMTVTDPETPAEPIGTAPGESLPPETTPEPGPAPDGPVDPDPDVETSNETLLRLAVRFYGAQRSGEGPNWLLDGQTCHTGDGESIGADLSGGWHDAGDHLKPTLTNAFASYLLLKAFEEFPTSFADLDDRTYGGAPNGIPDVLDEVGYATDYLVKAHVATDQLVGMVGSTNADHAQWVTCVFQESLDPEQGGHPRPVSMDANADIAGLTAGALALMARLVRPYDATLAEGYLAHAIEIYEIADANRSGSNPGLYGQTGGFGGTAQWTDEMLCGAVELYRETGEQRYLTDALELNERTGAHQWAPNWGQVADFCRHSLYLAGEPEAALEYWQQDVDNYSARVSNAQYVAGMVYFDAWGSLRYAANAAFSAALLHAVTGEESAAALAQSQLDYIAGENEHQRSFVVGFGENPPTQPHHRNAHGHDANDMSLPFEHVLAGALVGGPTATAAGNTTAGYVDDVADYVGNEVALDYNAGLVGLAAFAVERERR